MGWRRVAQRAWWHAASCVVLGGCALPLASGLTCTRALADDATATPAIAAPVQPHGWREVWAGADATRDVWLIYFGSTIAPFSADIYSDGLRLRSTGGYGQYSYRYDDASAVACARSAACAPSRRFKVQHSYTDVLVGYHKRFGELTAKAFVGATFISHSFSQRDPNNAVVGQDVGVKGVVELWLNLGPNAWTSLDLSYTTAHDTSSARWRAGWRVLPHLSIGPEARFDGNAETYAGRGGLFARYDWNGGEISLAGGVAGSVASHLTEDLAPYATINLLLQY